MKGLTPQRLAPHLLGLELRVVGCVDHDGVLQQLVLGLQAPLLLQQLRHAPLQIFEPLVVVGNPRLRSMIPDAEARCSQRRVLAFNAFTTHLSLSAYLLPLAELLLCSPAWLSR